MQCPSVVTVRKEMYEEVTIPYNISFRTNTKWCSTVKAIDGIDRHTMINVWNISGRYVNMMYFQLGQ